MNGKTLQYVTAARDIKIKIIYIIHRPYLRVGRTNLLHTSTQTVGLHMTTAHLQK